MQDFEARLQARDPALFAVPSESTEGDQVSLLLVQSAVRARVGPYRYLELGSHLGGMLVPHLLDPLCAGVVSIDMRPASQDDARGRRFDYEENSTARMLATLAAAFPGVPLDKLVTVDADAEAVTPREVPDRADLLMIDAEHTNLAAASDFLSLLKFARDDAVFLFHDANLVFEAMQIVERMLRHLEIPATTCFLYDNVGVMLLGASRDLAGALAERTQEREAYLQASRRYVRAQVAANA